MEYTGCQMKSFDDVFKNSEIIANSLNLQEVFNTFRENPGPYQFLTATKSQYWEADKEALEIANSTNFLLAQEYLKKEKPLLGYSSKETYVPIDQVDSRHIMMSTIIFSTLGRDIKNIVEIGAGFGNWARLNTNIVNYNNWTMIDLKFVSNLQKWYVSQTITNSKINFISADTDEYKSWTSSIQDIDLVIGAHSLSEFSLPIFEEYLDNILTKTTYFFYATHTTQPSKSLIEKKLTLINEKFDPVVLVSSQNTKVLNILYKRKIK